MEKITPKELNLLIGSQIYKAREAKKLSQEALSDIAGVSRVFISRLENGNQSAKIYTYYRIASALDLPLCELFRRSENISAMDNILHLIADCTDDDIRAYTELFCVVRKLFIPICE